MQRDTLAPLIIGALVLVAVIVGLFVVGGPATGRAEKRDEARWQDLRHLATFAKCVAKTSGELPETLGPFDECGTDIPFVDVITQNPYWYEKLSEISFRLCADLELPQRSSEYGKQVEDVGCDIYSAD